MANAPSMRLVVCGARLSIVGIRYEDQRGDVVDQHLVVVLVRLMIGPIVSGRHRQTINYLSSGLHRGPISD